MLLYCDYISTLPAEQQLNGYLQIFGFLFILLIIGVIMELIKKYYKKH